ELAYDDWCIAQMAHGMGRDDEYKLFMQRADNYKNVWDSKTQFMRPKKANGDWLMLIGDREQGVIETESGHSYYQYFDPLLIGRRPNRHYTESNAWQYIWSVQHNPLGLIDLFGSKDSFINKLDSLFVMSTKVSSPKYVGVVGTIGQYVQGNQPSHHVAYFYNYAGQPWKTQEKTHQILNTLYQNGPGGLCGNEDMGSLSSWYVLSAMGIYPFAPGSGYYTISSPLFDEVKLELRKGKSFTIKAENNLAENKYIQSATLNGKTFSRTYISHKEITDGGVLIFKMGKSPNKEWGLECIPAQ
ncbi:MAG: glycoside hydrolase family 92 protein, partial [Bacteroidales bacterium]|nr:glycoside hydrolase family 92 protein [Bacteroidales bacterium]